MIFTFLNRSHSLRLGWSFLIVGHGMDDEEDLFVRHIFFLDCKAFCWQQGQLENSICVYHKDEVSLIGWWLILSRLGYGDRLATARCTIFTVIEYSWLPRMWRDKKCKYFDKIEWFLVFDLVDCFVWYLCSFLIIQLLQWQSLLWNCQNHQNKNWCLQDVHD